MLSHIVSERKECVLRTNLLIFKFYLFHLNFFFKHNYIFSSLTLTHIILIVYINNIASILKINVYNSHYIQILILIL